MSVEVLRRAASLMRERAEGAADRTDTPWGVVEATGSNRDQRRTLGEFSMVHDNVAEVAILRGFKDERQPVAEHIASWHPSVALAVADLLDTVVSEYERRVAEFGNVTLPPPDIYAAIARAYLGESA